MVQTPISLKTNEHLVSEVVNILVTSGVKVEWSACVSVHLLA